MTPKEFAEPAAKLSEVAAGGKHEEEQQSTQKCHSFSGHDIKIEIHPQMLAFWQKTFLSKHSNRQTGRTQMPAFLLSDYVGRLLRFFQLKCASFGEEFCLRQVQNPNHMKSPGMEKYLRCCESGA